MSDDEYGTDIELTEELDNVLQAAESQVAIPISIELDLDHDAKHDRSKSQTPEIDVMDIEDLVQPSPFEEFKNGYLSVTDLVGTVWCEVQYDYRLRTLPYLPVSQRPEKIKTKTGKEIVVDKVKVEDKDRILKRGSVIHERLKREYHVRIELVPETREDVWGLRFLNMLSVLESTIDLGTGRELPVVGFVNDTLVLGVIDEIVREEIPNGKTDKLESGPRQMSLTSFYSPTKPRPITKTRTHRLRVSDSKTRASGTMPRESDTAAGQLQVMLYKELLDAMLQPTAASSGDSPSLTGVSMSFPRVFQHLALNADQTFSDSFRAQSEPIITGNKLRYGIGDAKCLTEMVRVWEQYVDLLGLGTPSKTTEQDGKTDEQLELVYRRADKKKDKGKRKRHRDPPVLETITAIKDDGTSNDEDDDKMLQLAIQRSLQPPSPIPETIAPEIVAASFISPPVTVPMTEQEREKEEDAIAWEIEMSYRTNGGIEHEGEPVIVRASQEVSKGFADDNDDNKDVDRVQSPKRGLKPAKKSGDIIGKHRFKHDPKALGRHLEKVMGYWQGIRMPEGVGIDNTRRCGWCEFEEGCEWRLQKAQEAMEKVRLRREKG